VALIQRPTTRAVPIDRTGPPACRGDVHRHCARCGVADETVYAAPLANGGNFPPLCLGCSVKVMRIRATERAVAALEGGCD